MPIGQNVMRRIETLKEKLQPLETQATAPVEKEQITYGARYLDRMAEMLSKGNLIFGVEPWHPLRDDLPLKKAGEFLLRVKDSSGAPLPPYPAVMAFYQNGFTDELDTILTLCALEQFRKTSERQISINISCKSLKNPDFLKAALSKIETLKLEPDEKIIFEIHESAAVVKISDKTAMLFRNFGVQFAIDDVGLSMTDVFRLSAFENIASYIKLDRKVVNSVAEESNSLVHILSLVRSTLPDAHVVAEGIQNVQHARVVHAMHPNVVYAQGLYLPPPDVFAKEWRALESV